MHLNHRNLAIKTKGNNQIHDPESVQLPNRRIALPRSPTQTARSTSESRPRTAPSQSRSSSYSATTNNTPTVEPPIPRIAIFADALSLKKLREQYQTIRKSPTLPDLSDTDSRRSQPKRTASSSASSAVTHSTASTPRLPDLNFDAKASLSRRQPASRSSHGVETAFGPPPSIVTRSSSYGSDTQRKSQSHTQSKSPTTATFAQRKDEPFALQSPTGDAFRLDSRTIHGSNTLSDILSAPTSPGTAPSNTEQSLNAMMDRKQHYSDAQEYIDSNASKYANGLTPDRGTVSGGTEGSEQSTEDLFLNLAQDSPAPARNTDADLERRLSRGRNNPQRSSVPLSSSISRTRRDSLGSQDSRSVVPTTERSYVSQRRASTASTPPTTSFLPRNQSSLPSSADSRFSAYRSRYAMSNTPQNSARRPSAPDTASMYSRPPVYRPSKLNQFSRGDFDSVSMVDSPLDHRPTLLRADTIADGAESVVSGAPSTVWDELHELKSRIQRMEMSDKIVSGSQGSGERPKTATTTLTSTMSSSPKHTFKTGRSPTDSVIGGPAAINAYPVFHQTLARCKETLSPALYRALEVASSDALEMALMTGNGGAGGSFSGAASVVNGGGGLSVERQLRRKADSVVRNLQDLSLALCANKPAELQRPGTSSSRPGTGHGVPNSRDGPPSATPGQRSSMIRASSRAGSVDPTDNSSDTTRVVQSRALDRIEARRVSMQASASNSPSQANNELQRHSLHLPNSVESTPSQQTISKVPRAGSSILRSRRAGTEEPEEDATQTLRPVSRAQTDIGALRQKRQNRLSGSFLAQGSRLSREYTSNVPLPESSPVAASPTVSTAGASSLRRLNGASLKSESPRAVSLAGSLLREPRRAMTEKEQTPEPETPKADDDSSSISGNRRALRRSLGLYTSSARASLGLGLGKSRAERRSVNLPSTPGGQSTES